LTKIWNGNGSVKVRRDYSGNFDQYDAMCLKGNRASVTDHVTSLTRHDVDSYDNNPIGPHRKRSHPLHFYRDCGKPEVVVWQKIQVAKMLDNRNSGSKEDRVYRTPSIIGIVDIQRINTDEGYVRIHKKLGCILGQEGMSFKILFALPMTIPSGMNQNCPPGNLSLRKKL
jgi:hypothetical protein